MSITGRSSCNGDSGGPLIARELADDPWYQIGLVSFGTKNCGTDVPSVYTKVAAHISWIKSILKPWICIFQKIMEIQKLCLDTLKA